MKRLVLALSGLLLLSTVAAPARATLPFGLGRPPPSLPPAAQAADIDEHLGGHVDRALSFRDVDGRRVTVGEALPADKPAVVVLAYYHCPMLCGLVLRGLVDGLRGAGLRLDADYHALTVSFDPHDTPEAARRKRASTLAGLGAALDAPGAWPFLVGTDRNVHALADELGIRYAYDARTQQYAHPAVAVVLTADGKISRYLYGVEFPSRDVRLALVEAGQGRTGTIVDRVLLTCYHYDPASHRYGAFILGFMRIGGALILLVVTLLVAVLFLRGKKETSARASGSAPGGGAP